VKLNDYDSALKYLESAAYLLLHNHDQANSISIDDLPGIGIWIDKTGTLEEPLKSSFTLIEKLFNHSNLEKSDLLTNLYDIYNQAYKIQENSSSG
jgi:hypothetical protein